MRKSMRASYVALVSLLGAVGLLIGSAFSAALAFGAIGLLVQGTGTPNANIVDHYMQNARDRYLQGTACSTVTNCGTPLEVGQNATLNGINYPASFWPLAFIPNWCRSGPDGCDKWDESVGQGAAKLQAQLEAARLTGSTEPIVLFGYSQGGAVVSNVLNDYLKNLSGPDADAFKQRIQIVTIGGIQTPDGGLWSRLSFLNYIPIFDISLKPALTPDPLIKQTLYSFHFDPVGDAPRYWGNPFALLNAVAALETVHGYYLTPNGNGPTETLPYGYTDQTLPAAITCDVGVNCRKDANQNEYVVIKATSLPIADFVYGALPAALRPLLKPFIELVAPAYRVLAELGYDYTGDPSVSTPLSILPFNPATFNPVNFALQFVGAIGQGIQNALGGGTSLSPLNPPAPAATTNTPAVQPLNQVAGEQSPTATADLASGKDVQSALTAAEGSTDVAVKTESSTDVVDAKSDDQKPKVEVTKTPTKSLKSIKPAKVDPADSANKVEPKTVATQTDGAGGDQKDDNGNAGGQTKGDGSGAKTAKAAA